MTLKVTVEGIYETATGLNQFEYTNFKCDINLDRVKVTGLGTHILRRFLPIELGKGKNAKPVSKIKNFLITNVEKVDDKISIADKDILSLSEIEIQQLATLFDLYEIPLPHTTTLSELREKAAIEYLKKVIGIKLDSELDMKNYECFKKTPLGYKLDFGNKPLAVDISRLKQENIVEVKPEKISIDTMLASRTNVDNNTESNLNSSNKNGGLLSDIQNAFGNVFNNSNSNISENDLLEGLEN